jgi:hypothetical protein
MSPAIWSNSSDGLVNLWSHRTVNGLSGDLREPRLLGGTAVAAQAREPVRPHSERNNRVKTAKQFFIVSAAFVLATTTFTIIAPKTAHAVIATLVQVANTSANPVPTQAIGTTAISGAVANADDPARNSVTLAFIFDFPDGQPRAFKTIYTVPPGHELVLDYFTAFTSLPQGGDTISSFQIYCPGQNQTPIARFKPEIADESFIASTGYMVNQHLQLYCDPGSQVELAAFRNGVTSSAGVDYSVSAHLVTLN